MENQTGDKAGAILSSVLTLFAVITIKDMQAIVTILAGVVAILSGTVSIYINLKKRNKN